MNNLPATLVTISGVRGYIDENGTAQLHLEDVSRGLGFVQIKGGVEYVRYERVHGYLTDMGFPHLLGKEFIPENVFYRLAMKGETEAALAFQAKVADEILPAIRKTGSYSVNMPRTFAEALRLAADQSEQIEHQQKLLAEAQPKVDFFDAVADSKDAIQIGDAAKVLAIPRIGRNNLFKVLRENRILMDNNRPYQEFVDRGYFRVVETSFTKPSGETCISIKSLVYQRGLDYIRKLLATEKSA